MNTKIYSKTGDKGMTSLRGGARVPKNHKRIEVNGNVDELISYMGLIQENEELRERITELESENESLEDKLFEAQQG